MGKSVSEAVHASRQAIAYLPESAALYEHLSAYENVGYFLELAGVPVTPSECEAALIVCPSIKRLVTVGLLITQKA